MQKESLVVVLPIPREYKIRHNWDGSNAHWHPNDNAKDIYTIRNIGPANDTPNEIAVVFHEGIIAMDGTMEIGLSVKYVREVQGPNEMSVQEIVNEAIFATI